MPRPARGCGTWGAGRRSSSIRKPSLDTAYVIRPAAYSDAPKLASAAVNPVMGTSTAQPPM